jgi:hypothetical protein
VNTGKLDIVNYPENCDDSQNPTIDGRKGKRLGTMECVWIVKAGGVGSFNSRNIPLTLYIEYYANETTDPIKLEFKNITEIEKSEDLKGSYSNSKIEIRWETGSTIPYDGESTIDFEIRNLGPGQVKKGKYKLSYDPPEILKNCPTEVKEEVGESVEFSCRLDPADSSKRMTANLFTSVSYIYRRQIQKNVKIVR